MGGSGYHHKLRACQAIDSPPPWKSTSKLISINSRTECRTTLHSALAPYGGIAGTQEELRVAGPELSAFSHLPVELSDGRKRPNR